MEHIHILDPITGSLIHSVGAMSVDDSDVARVSENCKGTVLNHSRRDHKIGKYSTSCWRVPQARDMFLLSTHWATYECCEGKWTPRELVD